MVQSFTVQHHVQFKTQPINQGTIQPGWVFGSASECHRLTDGLQEGGV